MRLKGFLRTYNRGLVLPLVMLAMVVLMLTGLGALRVGQSTRMRAIQTAHLAAAQSAADAGLTRALSEMNFRIDSLEGLDPVLGIESAQSLGNCEAAYSYEITKTTFEGGEAYRVQSTGSCGLASKRIAAVVGLVGPFERGVSVLRGISLKSGAVVDTYNVEPGEDLAVIGTMGTGASEIRIAPGAKIKGNVAIGYGGDPDTVVDYVYRSDIEGDIYTDSVQVDMPPVSVPESMGLLPSAGTLSGSQTIQKSGRYKDIRVNQGDIVTIDGPVTLYVSGDSILDNSAQIQINDANPDASLTLYLGGDLAMKNGGIINNLTKDANRLKIYGLPSTRKVVLHTAGSFYGAIYAPSADVYSMNSLDFWGSVASKSFSQAAKGNIHFDGSLRQVGEDDPGRYLAVKRWSEE